MFEQSVHGSAGSAALVGFMINGSLIMIDVITFEDELSGFVYKSPLGRRKSRKNNKLRTVAQYVSKTGDGSINSAKLGVPPGCTKVVTLAVTSFGLLSTGTRPPRERLKRRGGRSQSAHAW